MVFATKTVKSFLVFKFSVNHRTKININSFTVAVFLMSHTLKENSIKNRHETGNKKTCCQNSKLV